MRIKDASRASSSMIIFLVSKKWCPIKNGVKTTAEKSKTVDVIYTISRIFALLAIIVESIRYHRNESIAKVTAHVAQL
jgi:hypothetical protein